MKCYYSQDDLGDSVNNGWRWKLLCHWGDNNSYYTLEPHSKDTFNSLSQFADSFVYVINYKTDTNSSEIFELSKNYYKIDNNLTEVEQFLTLKH
jgi:hypothetical protein